MMGFYMQYLESLCVRRGWERPAYEQYHGNQGFTSLVYVNGREYQTDVGYESAELAQENAAMRAFMICRNFSVNSGMLARNGLVQGLPADENRKHRTNPRHNPPRRGPAHRGGQRHSHHSSSSSTTSLE